MKKFLPVALLIITSCALLSWKGESVTAIAEKFLNGMFHLDIPAAKRVATKETQEHLELYGKLMEILPDSSKDEARKTRIEIVNSDVKDSSAVVSYRFVYPENPQMRTLKLVQIDGDWKVQWTKMDDAADQPMNSPAVDTTYIERPDAPVKISVKKSKARTPARK